MPDQERGRFAYVAWRSRLTGATGHGEPIALEAAEASAEEADRTFPEADHWVVPVDAATGREKGRA